MTLYALPLFLLSSTARMLSVGQLGSFVAIPLATVALLFCGGWFFLIILATREASRGCIFRYPFTIRFLK